MRLFYILIFTLICNKVFAQTKDFTEVPYIETIAKIDTLIVPDRIYMNIILNGKVTKIENPEKVLINVLQKLNIDTEKNLSVTNMDSDFKKYFLKSQAILKAKSYELLVYDAATAGKVLVELEKIGISNISITKTKYSKANALLLQLKEKAIKQAKKNAETMANSLSQKIGKAIFVSDRNSAFSDLTGSATGFKIRGVGKIEDESNYETLINFKKIPFEVFIEAKFKLE